MYILKNKTLLNKQIEATQAEIFIDILKKNNYTTHNECNRLIQSYKLIIAVRNLLHLFQNQKNDRFEFNAQIKISEMFYSQNDAFELIHERNILKRQILSTVFPNQCLKDFRMKYQIQYPILCNIPG